MPVPQSVTMWGPFSFLPFSSDSVPLKQWRPVLVFQAQALAAAAVRVRPWSWCCWWGLVGECGGLSGSTWWGKQGKGEGLVQCVVNPWQKTGEPLFIKWFVWICVVLRVGEWVGLDLSESLSLFHTRTNTQTHTRVTSLLLIQCTKGLQRY